MSESLWTIVPNTTLDALAAESSSVQELVEKLRHAGNLNPEGDHIIILEDGPFADAPCKVTTKSFSLDEDAYLAVNVAMSHLNMVDDRDALLRVVYHFTHSHLRSFINLLTPYIVNHVYRNSGCDNICPGTHPEELNQEEADIVGRILTELHRHFRPHNGELEFAINDAFDEDRLPALIPNNADVAAYKKFSLTKKAHARAQIVRTLLWTLLKQQDPALNTNQSFAQSDDADAK